MQDKKTPIARKKLINTILFFASNTKFCGKIKLFKLLYLADFEHFSQTGKSITGFEYQAWKFGPVPTELMEEWEELSPDMAEALHIESEKEINFVRQAVKVNKGISFDDALFTPRELRIMSDFAEKFRETKSAKLIDVTHEQNGAWDTVWRKGFGDRETIPYALAIKASDGNRDALIEIGAEQHMYQAALKASRLAAQQPIADY
jgi:uncharacterized phage-associated protein